MRIVLVGPPGAGKGTQAGRIVDRFGGVHIATGDILRSNAERGTELGLTASRYMDRGDLVPDEVIIGMVLERMGEGDRAGGFVLDGFPRTVPQAEALERRLEELGCPLDAVVSFEIDEGELRDRLAGRAEEQDRAEDDDEGAIRRRLELFNRKTEPLAQGLGLGHGAREPVEHEAAGAVALPQPLQDHVDDHVVGDQLTPVHVPAGRPAQLRPPVGVGPQDVTGGDVHPPEPVDEPAGLGALAGGGRADQDDAHPLTPSSRRTRMQSRPGVAAQGTR